MTGKRKTILLSILLLVATIFMVAPVSAAEPTITIIPDKDTVYVGEPVNFTGTFNSGSWWIDIEQYGISYDGEPVNWKPYKKEELDDFTTIYTTSGEKTITFWIDGTRIRWFIPTQYEKYATTTITVLGTPTPDTTLEIISSGPYYPGTPVEIKVRVDSDTMDDVGTTWTLDYGNGTTIEQDGRINTDVVLNANYADAGEYILNLTAQNRFGETSSVEKTIVIGDIPEPTATLEIISSGPYYPGTPVEIKVRVDSGTTDDVGTTWTLDYGNGTTIEQDGRINTDVVLNANYADAGEYILNLTAQNRFGEASSVEKTITVNDIPVPDISVRSEPGSIYVTQTITAIGEVVPNENIVIKQWEYDFDDGTIVSDNTSEVRSVIHTYENIGSYTLCFAVWEERDEKHVTNTNVNVYDIPEPSIEFNANQTEIVPGDPVEFIVNIANGSNSDVGYDVAIEEWVIDYGDGNVSDVITELDATIVYNDYVIDDSIYMVKVIVTDECGATHESDPITITVGDVPSMDIDFEVTPTTGEGPLDVEFTVIPDEIEMDGRIVISDIYVICDEDESIKLSLIDGVYTGNYIYENGVHTPYVNVIYTVNGREYEQTFGSVEVKVGSIFLTANPTTGKSPLSVTFTDESQAIIGNYKVIEFGDGASVMILEPDNMSVAHTYTKGGSYTAILTYYAENEVTIGNASVTITVERPSGGSGRQHRANINLDDDATFIPLTGAYAGFEEYLQFSISDSQGVDEVLSAYMRGGEISFPGPIPGPLQNGQCVMDYPYIISDGFVQQSAVWGSGLATDVYMTNPGKKIRLNVWKKNNLPSEMTFMVYDKNKEHLLYEETFDVKKQMFDISFELPTGVVSDMIEPWE